MADAPPPCVVVMGVSGCGKSTLGAALARALAVEFVEGDTLHPPANIAKMASGHPLDDEDRVPFLAAVGEVLRLAGQRRGVVATCSALKRRYRDTLRAAQPRVVFVLPVVGDAALFDRLRKRQGHFMPAALLQSQLDDFEPPGRDEDVVRIDGELSRDAQVRTVLDAMGLRRRA